MTVAPLSLTILPGGTGTYTVTMRRTTAPLETWSFGHVTWSSGGVPQVRSPLTAKASEIVLPSLVTDTRAIGTKVFTIGTGYDGSLLLSAIGLVPATRNTSVVQTNQRVCFPINVPAGARQLRVQLFNGDTQGGAASDLDLVVLRGATTVGTSGGGDSNELVVLVNPAAGAYQGCVDGFAPVNGQATFTMSHWVVGPAVGPQTLRALGPSRVTVGGTASIAVAWNVPAGARYLGVVDYRSVVAGPLIGSTTVYVDNAPGAALMQKLEVGADGDGKPEI